MCFIRLETRKKLLNIQRVGYPKTYRDQLTLIINILSCNNEVHKFAIQTNIINSDIVKETWASVCKITGIC